MTCKDCIHYDVCKKYNNVYERELSERYCVECQYFKKEAETKLKELNDNG